MSPRDVDRLFELLRDLRGEVSDLRDDVASMRGGLRLAAYLVMASAAIVGALWWVH